MERKTPAFALRFLRWFCPTELYEGIEGDILEQYDHDLSAGTARRARWRLVWNVIRFFRPAILLRNVFSFQIINTAMLRNYLTIAFRNIWKNKVFSSINVFGLGIGLAACLLIFQFVSFHWSFDEFNSQLDRTYRVTNDRFQHGKLIQHGTIMYPTIGPAMAKDYPEIELQTRLMPGGDANIKIGNEFFRLEECHFVDERFFSVFDFPFLAGDRVKALKDRYAIVLTESTARQFFGVKDNDFSTVLGKTLYEGLDTNPYTVTGVCADVPENSHIFFDAMISYATLISPENQEADNSWQWSDMRHYLVLKPGTDYKQLEAKFPSFSDRYFKGDKVSGSVEKFYLQPLREAHMYSNYEYDIARTVNGKAVWAMLIVAAFILLIAWINYINLTTSRAMDRAKEVGLRKVMGAFKSQLVKQFIFESILVSAVAFLVAIILVQLAQSSFNQIAQGKLSLWHTLGQLDRRSVAILICVMTGGMLLSGFYPAFILSSYQPVTVLKGKFQRSTKGALLRKSLVVFQFAASAALITGTIIVSKQLHYMNSADLGINIQKTLIVRGPERTAWDSTFNERIVAYKAELLAIKDVSKVTTSGRLIGTRLGRSFGIRLAEMPSTSKYTLSVMNVAHDFFDTYQVPLLAGRYFLPTDHKVEWNDLRSTVLNENAVHLLGIKDPQDIIGKEIVWGRINDAERKWTVVGVVGNFHQESLKKEMEPMAFRPAYGTYDVASIKFLSNDPQQVIAGAEAVFKKFFPDNSFRYFFLEDRYQQQYDDDRRFGTIINIFTVLAIVISCLGLIGLSGYTATQRTKEIGIRKVLGASMSSLVTLLSADFVKLVLLAAIIALPIAYVGANNWLQTYAYRTTLAWWLFVVPALLILLIAVATIGFHVLRAATTNPADTLKYE